MINIEEVLKNTGALLDGHFKLTSGKHSDRYIDKMQVLQYPHYTEIVAREMAKPFAAADFDLVIGPAMGGIILAYEVGKILNKRAFFSHRDKDGKMAFRPSFQFEEGARILVVEDIVSTGGSVFELLDLIKSLKGDVIGVSLIVDRSGGKVDFGVRTESLLTLQVDMYQSDECPLCKKNVPMSTLGSTGKK